VVSGRPVAGAFLLTLAWLGSARADEVVQLPLTGVLDGRPVSTFTNGVEVPWTAGVDQADGFITKALATHLGQAGPALPDDGAFPEDADHPAVMLHFSNAASPTAPQAHLLTAAGTIEIPIAPATYARLFLILTSSRGDSTLDVTLSYDDGTTSRSTITLPDWGTGKPLPTTPPIFFNLVAGLHKWNAQDTSVDTPTHAITGFVVMPAAGKALSKIVVEQTTAARYLTLWGVTGLATGAPGDAVPDAAGDVDAAPAPDAAGGIDAGADAPFDRGVSSPSSSPSGCGCELGPSASSPARRAHGIGRRPRGAPAALASARQAGRRASRSCWTRRSFSDSPVS